MVERRCNIGPTEMQLRSELEKHDLIGVSALALVNFLT